ncbi:MAG: phospholipase D-like domain-containing protein, partial [Burkholderiaceae bacterium]
MRHPHFTTGNAIRLLQSGAQYFPALIEAFDAAAEEILLETYIFAEDEAGNAIRDALLRAAKRGVRVRVITDWHGTGRVRNAELHAAFTVGGVEHRAFNPWFRQGVARTHRKMCAVDRRTAFVGGMNLVGDLSDDDHPEVPLPAPRWDFAVRIEGPLVHDVRAEIDAQWRRLAGMNVKARWQTFRSLRRKHPDSAPAGARAALVVRDNLRNRRAILRGYLQALGRARHTALIANPYFAPGRKLRRALEKAADRGVDVTLLLGVGQYSIQDAVAHSYYPKLLKHGVKLVEYRHTQLHGKVALIDDEWATVGSSNCDGLSLFVNQEA